MTGRGYPAFVRVPWRSRMKVSDGHSWAKAGHPHHAALGQPGCGLHTLITASWPSQT